MTQGKSIQDRVESLLKLKLNQSDRDEINGMVYAQKTNRGQERTETWRALYASVQRIEDATHQDQAHDDA